MQENMSNEHEERGQNLSEKNFKEVISQVDKLKEDIKDMREQTHELKQGQQSIIDLLSSIEDKVK